MKSGTSLARGGATSARTALSALCERKLPSHALGQELRARLRRLLDFDAYCLNTCDTDSGIVTSSVGDGLSPEHARALFALEAEGGDLNCLRYLHRGPARIGSLWQQSGGHPEHSQRMREIFLPLGFGDELRAALVVDQVCYGYLHLFRRTGHPPFSAADLHEAEAVSSLIARGLRSAASLAARRVTPCSSASRVMPTLILLDSNDQVVRQSPGAQRALGARDSLRVDSGLPHVLRDLASRSRRGGDARATLVAERAEPLSISAVQLGPETAIVIDEPGVHDLEALSLAGFGLTRREREVSRLVALGHSNQSIAAELGITLYTVKDHVKAALVKTRSASRTELAARLRGA